MVICSLTTDHKRNSNREVYYSQPWRRYLVLPTVTLQQLSPKLVKNGNGQSFLSFLWILLATGFLSNKPAFNVNKVEFSCLHLKPLISIIANYPLVYKMQYSSLALDEGCVWAYTYMWGLRISKYNFCGFRTNYQWNILKIFQIFKTLYLQGMKKGASICWGSLNIPQVLCMLFYFNSRKTFVVGTRDTTESFKMPRAA